MPLRAVLQAYRSGHHSFRAIMCKVIGTLSSSPAAGMRATMLLSDYCIECTDLISVVRTEAYVAEDGSLARVAGRRRQMITRICGRSSDRDADHTSPRDATEAWTGATGAAIGKRVRTCSLRRRGMSRADAPHGPLWGPPEPICRRASMFARCVAAEKLGQPGPRSGYSPQERGTECSRPPSTPSW